jgi:hypothetical protein
MKPLVACALFSLLAPFAGANPAEEIKAAAKKLAEAANYSWTTTTEVPEGSRWTPGPINGKMEKDGFAHVTTTFGENTSETVYKGGAGAVKTEGGWKTAEELDKEREAARAQREAGSGGGGNGEGQRRGPRGLGGRMLRDFKAPATQAEELAAAATELTSADGAITGQLPEAKVKELLSFGGGRRGGEGSGDGPQIASPKGSVTFWLKDGSLAKMQVKVAGSMTFGDNTRQLDRTTTTEIKEVGTTKLEVPAEAKAKFTATPATAPAVEKKID